ncbi:MAG: protein translocase subunit SecD [Victivallales bacterium]|nr:protein translocase subunit SecD [Victivallales bacterium]
MNKKPVLLRSILALAVIAVFAISIYPLHQRDFFTTFLEVVGKPDAKIKEVVALAQTKKAKDKNLFDSIAVEQAASELGVNLCDYVKFKGISNNRDVISLVRKRAASSIRLGLDLNGGVEFILKLSPEQKGEVTAGEKIKESESTDSMGKKRDIAIEILRNRLEQQNIYEMEIAPAGDNYISLKAPIVAKDEKLRLYNLIKMSAKMQFRLVHPNNKVLIEKYLADPKTFKVPPGYELMESTNINTEGKRPVHEYYLVSKRVEMGGENVVEAFPTQDEFGRRRIILRFNMAGSKQFGNVTRHNIGRLLAIVLDNKLYSAPQIQSAIEGNGEITGNFSREEAETISHALVGGSLPVKIEIEAVFDTDPTLGLENIHNGIYAGIFATLLVILFMGVYYRRAGIVADIALLVNILLLLGAMAAFQCTLTLPGIAGIILTIGMAVDANVLIYERIREELRSGKSLANAINMGYERAFSTILDSNLTTLFTGIILMTVGTGPIKGFAVTLTIGIVTSMFSALFITRLLFDLMERWFRLKTLPMFQFFRDTKFQFMAHVKPFLILSSVLLVFSLAVMGIRGRDMLGVDFTGGTVISFNYDKYLPKEDITKVLEKAGFQPKVTYKTSTIGDSSKKKLEILIRESDLSKSSADAGTPKERIEHILHQSYPDAGFKGGAETSIGGLIGWEFTKKALQAVLLAMLSMIIYITVRYEMIFAMAAVVAMLHDALIATGIYLFLGMVMGGHEITLSVVAAIMTLIGYSVNDTVVIFDRIRETVRLNPNVPLNVNIDNSVNATLSRTILTSVTTMIVVAVMLLTGGTAIRDFVLIMFIGIIIGSYSSIFIASPIVSYWHRKTGRAVHL